MSRDEASELAAPIARLIGRKVHVKGQLGVIRDGAETAASTMGYFDRIFADPIERVQPAFSPQATYRPQASEPPAGAVPLTPEPRPAQTVQSPTAGYRAPEAPPIHDPNGQAVPGVGPNRDRFLSGFGEE